MKLKRADKRKRQEELEFPQRSKFTRACSGATTSKAEKSCFFCGRSSEALLEASTFNIDTRVRECAHQLQDKTLIAKLSAGDMISQEAVYHAKCLVALYNKAERSKQSTINGNEKRFQGTAFGTTKRRRDNGTTGASYYHSRDREPPLPIYLGLMTHAERRKRTLVDKLYNLGLSISYDRVLELSTDMGNSVCAHFESEGVICLPKLLKGVFTTAAVDNIDHSQSSVTAQGAFHGTGISLFQHPTSYAPGEEREMVSIDNQPSKTNRLARLPDSYTAVRPVILPKNEPDVPPLQGPFVRICPGVKEAFSLEYKWLEHVRDELNREISQNILQISWAVFHANKLLPNRKNQLSRTSLLPLFHEEAAMICHAIDVITKAVKFLNQGQVPVLACDQPLYTIAKEIQWNFPTVYGEKKLVVMFGGFHIELAALKALGSLIEDSGWTSVLVQAGVITPGTADSFLKASHVSRTRHAYQVTAAALYILKDKAYKSYREGVDEGEEPMSFSDWCKQAELESSQFHYWSLTLHFQLTILIFVRSSSSVRDMECLETEIPAIAAEFKNSNFVVNKTNRAIFLASH